MAMMAMTTSSSIRVKPLQWRGGFILSATPKGQAVKSKQVL
jgi:hypothetical protein